MGFAMLSWETFPPFYLKKKKAHKSHPLTKGSISNTDRLLATATEHSVARVEDRPVVMFCLADLRPPF